MLKLSRFLGAPIHRLSLKREVETSVTTSLLRSPPVLFLSRPAVNLSIVTGRGVEAFVGRVGGRHGVAIVLAARSVRSVRGLYRQVVLVSRKRGICSKRVTIMGRHFNGAEALVISLRRSLRDLRLGNNRIFGRRTDHF